VCCWVLRCAQNDRKNERSCPASGAPHCLKRSPRMKSPHVPLTARPLPPANLVAELWRDSPLRRTTYGIMFFFGVGMYLGLLCWPGDLGGLLLWASLGAIIGSIAAWAGSRRGPELGLVPLGGLLLVVALVALGQTGRIFWLGVAGAAGGIFLMPLQAYVRRALGDARGWAAIRFVGRGRRAGGRGAVLSPLHVELAGPGTGLPAGWTHPRPDPVRTASPPAPDSVRRDAPHRGAVLSGEGARHGEHPGGRCAGVVQSSLLRGRRRAADCLAAAAALHGLRGLREKPVVRYLFRAAGVIPVNPNKPLKGIRLAWDALQAGELVCIFPEGEISRTGQLMELRRGFETIVQHAKVPVVPAAIDGLWGSVYSFAGNRYLWKSPRLMPTHVCVVFGPAIRSEQADVAHLRKAMLDVGAEAFQERPDAPAPLGREIARALAKRPRHIELVDRTAERRAVSAGQLLAVAATLSRYLRKNVPEKRVGIVLPPGAGAHIVNLAIAFADKVPVNLNFTAGKTAIEASLKLGEINTVITADAMRAKVPNFPFPAHTLDLKATIEAAGGKRAIVPWLLAAWLLPNQWVANLLELPKVGDEEEAALLFTSGSSGEPKGVVLTHRNIFANCAQISSLSILPDTAVLMACLPVFHSFGFTVTLWYPLLRGCTVITVPSPLDTKKIVEAIQQEQATVMLGGVGQDRERGNLRAVGENVAMREHNALRLARAAAGEEQRRLLLVAHFGQLEQVGHPLVREQPRREQPRHDGPFAAGGLDGRLQVERVGRKRKIRHLRAHGVGG